MRRSLLLSGLACSAFAVTYLAIMLSRQLAGQSTPDRMPGMVWIPGGEFTMGADSSLAWPDEKPAHRVRVNGFWMDESELTNAQFRAFAEATGYQTTAETPPDVDEIMRQLPPGTPL